MSLDVLFFCSLSAGFAGLSRLVHLLEAAWDEEKIPRKLLWLPGLSFLSQRLPGFAKPAADFYYSTVLGIA